MTAVDGVPFSPVGELPAGRVAIQASAGTGKTFTLAALATRFIAEGGLSTSELLIVTFTRAATSELRARVRDQLIEAADFLAGDRQTSVNEPLLEHLAQTDRDLRLERVRRAITEFDAATITTIHGFATQVRGVLGASAGIDPDARLVDDLAELAEEACTDVLARAAVRGDPLVGLPGLKELSEATRQAAGQPDLALVPGPDEPGATSEQRVLRQLVVGSIEEIAERRGSRSTLSFDDVLTQLRGALHGPRSAAAVDALRGRFRVALIDEFQDTDPIQWDIFSTLFGEQGAGSALVLVGDPKQAIYGFRGADIHTYLEAVGSGSGTECQSLLTCWRSDGAVLDSLHVLLGGATFGDDRIPFVPVEAAPQNQNRRMRDTDGRPLPALSFRVAAGSGIRRNKNLAQVQTHSAAQAIDADLVAHVRRLLDTAHIPGGSGVGGTRPLRPSDIGVLVGTRAQGDSVHAALIGQGVPAVVAHGGSVLESPAADQLRYLLEAMGRPSDPRTARMFAMSWFVGWTAEQVALAAEHELTRVQDQLRNWSDMLAGHGVAEVFARIWSETGVAARVLRGTDGDRELTDLDHLVELFDGAASSGLASVAGLAAILDAPPQTDADADTDGNVAARRIESEDQAVQIMTVWTAKGLEFPVVCVPTLWRDPARRGPVIYTDERTGKRTLDVTGGAHWPDRSHAIARKERSDHEAAGERLRLLYVALTRAKHQTVVWWANGPGSDKTALAHVLFARAGGAIDRDLYARTKVPIPSDHDVLASLHPLVERTGGNLTVGALDLLPPSTDRWSDPHASRKVPSLVLAPFDASPDRSTQRWSFSAITDHSSVAGFDPYDPSLSDRGAEDEHEDDGDGSEPRPMTATSREGAGGGPEGAGGNRPGPLAWLPAGTAFGTMVHAVLEEVDFVSAVIAERLGPAIDRQLAWQTFDLTPVWPVEAGTTDGRRLLIEGLQAAIATPLGPLGDGLRLADLGLGDRLNEMSFDLRLGEGGRRPQVREIGRLTASYLEPTDPLRPWAVALADGAIDLELAGHLTGSIDLVMRIVDREGRPRFVVADYKTNQLTRRGCLPGRHDYRPARLAAAMVEHDYPLQALLYSVALHRYLRWRLPDYDPSTHLGGVTYLFVRGMTGPEVERDDGRSHGVFGWSLPPALVVDLSDLLDGRLTSGQVP